MAAAAAERTLTMRPPDCGPEVSDMQLSQDEKTRLTALADELFSEVRTPVGRGLVRTLRRQLGIGAGFASTDSAPGSRVSVRDVDFEGEAERGRIAALLDELVRTGGDKAQTKHIARQLGLRLGLPVEPLNGAADRAQAVADARADIAVERCANWKRTAHLRGR